MLPRARPAAVTRSGVTALTVTAGSVRGGLRVEMQAMSLAAAHFVCYRSRSSDGSDSSRKQSQCRVVSSSKVSSYSCNGSNFMRHTLTVTQ
jgi:hypothetical protein